MLLSPFTSPRRLAFVIIFVFLAVVALVRNSQYSDYLPDYDLPSFGSDVGGQPGRPATKVEPPKDGDMWHEYNPDQDGLHAPPPVLALDDEYEEQPAPVEVVADAASEAPSSSAAAAPSASAASATHAAKVTPIPHTPYREVQEKIKAFIQWDRPNTGGHWPGYGDYENKDYDPNRWEGLPMDTAFYANNGIAQLEKQGLNATPYLPYPDYSAAAYTAQWYGRYAPCIGARGKPLDASPEDIVTAWPQLPPGFPNISVGAAAELGIDAHSCFDRDSRYGPYSSDAAAAPDWADVRWGHLQDQCLGLNRDRYATHARSHMQLRPSRTLPREPVNPDPVPPPPSSSPSAPPAPAYRARTAILIRTWEGYVYTDNDLEAIRALVTETSLLSGGEYQVYLLVNVKQHDADIYDDKDVYQSVLEQVVPRELRDISVLWTEKVCEEWYPKVGDWQVYWMQFMPLQWFSKTHPEFDFVWNWETDARYTGNHYHFLEQVAAFARRAPRKHLWERNSRFFLPHHHGDYASFVADTDAQVDNASAAGVLTPVWGPQPYAAAQVPVGPAPPHAQDRDRYTWGVGEEADLITLQPIWDPTQTQWSFRHKIWNFVPGVRPVFTPDNAIAEGFYHEGFDAIPRRTFINTLARFSKRQLHAMHYENREGRAMQAEMWPATVALHHGLKAVYAPHPIWSSHHWPAWYADAVFNADGGVQARWGQQADSPYAHDREVNFKTWSWYYASDFPKTLFWRWLGWAAKDAGLGSWGGPDAEDAGVERAGELVGGQGKMCLPGMLLHPVKKVAKPAATGVGPPA